jgi:hypothetical protein
MPPGLYSLDRECASSPVSPIGYASVVLPTDAKIDQHRYSKLANSRTKRIVKSSVVFFDELITSAPLQLALYVDKMI